MVNFTDLVTAGLAAVTALGGVGVVSAGVAKLMSDHTSKKWLQEHQGKLNEALETHRSELAKVTDVHRMTLKRQELIYQRELEAGDALMKVWRASYPQYRFPDMTWDDACEDVAGNLGSLEKALEDFLESHSVAISGTVRDLIEAARSEAATEKFFVEEPNVAPPKAAREAAGRALDNLKTARDQMLTELRR
jgi:ribosomal 50S subunit-associated protein YjgA (DUF615 family)